MVSYKTTFEYDSLDRLTRLTYPDADQLRYEYNDRNLLQRIPGGFTAGQAQPGNILSNLLYLPSGQMAQIDYGNGVRTTYAYDSRLRLKNLLTVSQPSTLNQQLINFAYDFDGVSNIKSIADLRPGSTVPEGDPRRNTQLFQYDDLYRLTRVQYSFALPGAASRNDGEINYRYDRIGNMLAQTSTLNHQEHGLPVANLGQMDSGGSAGRWNRTGRAPSDPPGPHALTSITPPSTNSPRAYPYDSNGNMTNIDGLVCTWDFKDRLVAVENAEMRAAYTYDYTDRRILKQVWPKATNSLPASSSQLLTSTLYINKYFEVREHDAPTKYVWNGNTRVARVTGSLNTNVRVQRLRVHPGWNLCSLAVTVTNGFQQLADGASVPASLLVAYSWDSSIGNWQLAIGNSPLPAGTVLWLQAATNATLTITGTYADPTNRTVTASGDFLPSAGLEAWNILSAISNQPSTILWTYDALFTRWLSWLPPPLELQSDLPAFLAPGQAVFARADAPAQLEVPESALRIRYYHQDHLGSSAYVSDGAGNLVEDAGFYPFGGFRRGFSSIVQPESYKFTQKERDRESSFSYFETRYLVSSVGRFLNTDPLTESAAPHGNPQFSHPYAYAGNRPITHYDPDGRIVTGLVDLGITAYDTYQVFAGNISRQEYAGRMALNAAALIADAASGGFGGGIAVRTASVAARAGSVGTTLVKAAIAVNKANNVIQAAEAAVSAKEAVSQGSWWRAGLSALRAAAGFAGMAQDMHALTVIPKGAKVNRAFDSRWTPGSKEFSGPLGSSFSPGSELPQFGVDARIERGLSVARVKAGVLNNAERGVIYSAGDEIVGVSRTSIGGSAPELVIPRGGSNKLVPESFKDAH